MPEQITMGNAIEIIRDLPIDPDGHTVVAIVGGTNSGKTTFTKNLAQIDDRTVHFPQDTYQLGHKFPGIETSKYRADDRLNFALGECALDLASLKLGYITAVPTVGPQRYERGDITRLIIPRPLILWEGIYAVLTPELEELADTIFYVDAPYALRLVRRLSRTFKYRGGIITDEQATITPTRALTSILLAEKDFVITQKPKADYTIRFDDDMTDKAFGDLEEAHISRVAAKSLGELHDSKQLSGNASLDLHMQGLAIYYQGRQIYGIRLAKDTMATAVKHFDYIKNN